MRSLRTDYVLPGCVHWLREGVWVRDERPRRMRVLTHFKLPILR
jgi:hypothetical protein